MMFALLAVVIVAPFERALFTLPGGMTMTSVELVTLCAIAAYVTTCVRQPAAVAGRVPHALMAPVAAFLVVLGIAAMAASIDRANAVRFVARMGIATSLWLAVASTIDTRQRARLLARVAVGVATVVASIAVLEAVQIPAVMTALIAFRPGFHVVAGQLRATSTLFYPTIASMYLEIAFVIGLWLLLDPAPRNRRLERVLVFAALVVIGAGISATFTRAGLLAMAAALGIVASLRLARVTRQQADLGVLTALGTALIAVTFFAHSPDLLAARLSTEGSHAWYGATYAVPGTARMQAGNITRVPITLTNTGRLAWDSQQEPAFALAYHWLRDGVVVEFEGERTLFPVRVRPGQRVTLDATVEAPGEPGAYTLVWDIVHETRAWLSTEGVSPARTEVTVSGAPAWRVAPKMSHLPGATIRPARPVLWAAALDMARDHPFLGVGPDNYRLTYGTYVGAHRADPRVHANNMYLEVLAGAGVPGLLALLVLLGVSAVTLWRRWQSAREDAHVATAVAIALFVVIAAHGIVDSFLSFTTTYVMFAVAGGWAMSSGLIEEAPDAHRV